VHLQVHISKEFFAGWAARGQRLPAVKTVFRPGAGCGNRAMEKMESQERFPLSHSPGGGYGQ
jgi:hypothetical protein